MTCICEADDDDDEDVPSKQTRSVVIGEEIPLLRPGCLGGAKS